MPDPQAEGEVKPRVVVELTCPECGGTFMLPLNWWGARFDAGKPRMSCRDCGPELYP